MRLYKRKHQFENEVRAIAVYVRVRLTFAYSVPVPESNAGPGKVIYLGACLIAAVRLAKEENWTNTPRVASRISDAIELAKRIYSRMQNDYPSLR